MNKLIFLSIITLGLAVRLYGLNWDQNTHLHPDERMIVMTAERLHYDFNCLKKDIANISISQYLNIFSLNTPNLPNNPDCNLNPKFFAYGSFPIYLLKFSGAAAAALTGNPSYAGYDGLPQIGRLLNIFFDLATLLLLGLIAKNLINSKFEYKQSLFSRKLENRNSKQYQNPNVQMTKTFRILNFENLNLFRASDFDIRILPYLAMFFYAFAVFPIQNAKFYTVDTLLTFLSTLTIYFCLKFYQQPSFKGASLIGLGLGLALATKISAILLSPTILFTLILFLHKRPGGPSLPNISISQYLNIFLFLKFFLIIFTFSFLIFNLVMPFALLDRQTFLRQLLEQTRMQKDPFTFPFTLQYVNTTPYWYFVKNILLWGLGLPLGLLALAGTIYFFYQLIPKSPKIPDISISQYLNILISNFQSPISIVASFFLIYFLVIGNSAVKFMRYLLPLYPFLCLFAAHLLTKFLKNPELSKPLISQYLNILISIIIFSHLLFTLSFLSIYSKPHTRIQASQWMVKNIPATATLAHENWDDTLPLVPHSFTKRIELSTYTYEPNNQWSKFAEDISRSDYIIISSNRLYGTLTRLTDCTDPKLIKHNRCYPKTARFYNLLLNNQLQGFTKVAEFTSYPTLPLISQYLNILISFRDEGADESFTVYDHPAVFIFQNTGFSPQTFLSQIP